MIYITGDTHGEKQRFLQLEKEKKLTEKDIVIVCGDFGFVFFNDRSETRILDSLEKKPYHICFIDGNHERFPTIYSYPEELWCGGRVHRLRKNILHLMRGQVFTVEGKKIFTMGGAYSVDRCMRELNVSYWEEELPNELEYVEAIRNLERNGNRVDIVLTHTCPVSVIRELGYENDEHDIELTSFLERLKDEIKYSRWYFGHWHMDKRINEKFRAVYYNVIQQ